MLLANSLTNSEQLYKSCIEVIPNASQTLSKCADRFVNGAYPKFIRRGDGCIVEDVDGNLYTDFICGLGPIILGYNNKYVSGVVKKQIEQGTIFSLSSPLEAVLAAKLKQEIKCAQKSKFFKTGSEVLSAAVKVARAYTGKEKVAVCGYHGWHDWYSIVNDKKAGIPKCLEGLVSKFKYNDLDSLKSLIGSGEYAAVVMEPAVYDEPEDDFLNKVKELTHQHGALLIYDEVVTGIRFGLGGASAYFGCVPDLMCLSKGLGNGFPIGALVGYDEYMNVWNRDDFFVSGTFGGDLVGISAAIAVIDSCKWHENQLLKRIWTNGHALKEGFNSLCKALDLNEINCIGYAPRTMFNFPTPAHKGLFWQECIKQGTLFGYANFINSAMSKFTIETTLNHCETALRVVKEHYNEPIKAMEGSVPIEALRMR